MSATRRNGAQLHAMKLPRQQRGVSILTAVFLITGLAVLGAMMTRMMTMSSKETISEWYSAQALYAAESGVDWAARYIMDNNTCGTYSTTDREVINGRAWFDLSISCNAVDALNLYTISSTGKAGGSSATSQTQRELQVLFSLDN